MAERSQWNRAVTNNILAFINLKKKLYADLQRNEQYIMKYASHESKLINPPFLLSSENAMIRTKLSYVDQILPILMAAWINDGILPRHELEIFEARLNPLLSDGDKCVLEEFYWIENIIDTEDPDSDIFKEWVRYIDRLIQKVLAAIYIFSRVDFLQHCWNFIWYFFNDIDDNSGADALILLLQEQPSGYHLNYHQNEEEFRFGKTYFPFT